jgi:hypothetical protein
MPQKNPPPTPVHAYLQARDRLRCHNLLLKPDYLSLRGLARGDCEEEEKLKALIEMVEGLGKGEVEGVCCEGLGGWERGFERAF